MKNLDDVLKELKEAEKEYQEKCLKYGIEEKVKRKAKVEENNNNTTENLDNNSVTEEKSQENK